MEEKKRENKTRSMIFCKKKNDPLIVGHPKKI